MLKKRITNPKGFTLIELMVAIVVALIVLLGIGAVLADSHRSWNRMYNRIYSDVVTDSYVARRTFDAVIRKASSVDPNLVNYDDWVEVYYYADANSAVVDRYARFFSTGGQLNVEYGELNPRQTLTIQTICGNVQGCVFSGTGRSAQMILTLDNGSQTATVVSSAVMHNQ